MTQEVAIRVPSIGLTLDERHIVREAYQVAESMLRDYEDAPGPLATLGKLVTQFRQAMRGLYQAVIRN